MMIQAFVEGELGHFLNAQSKAVGVGGGKAMRIVTGAIRKKIAGNIRRAGFRRRRRRPGAGGALARRRQGRRRRGRRLLQGDLRAGRMRPGGPVDLVQLFAQGATIHAASGTWLAIPTEYAPVAGGRGVKRRASPAEMQAMGIKLVFLPSGPDRAVAVRRDGGRSVVTHVLVRQVILRKRFDVESAVNSYVAQFPEILAREINAAAESSAVLQRYGG